MSNPPPLEQQIEHALDILGESGIIAYPTDTVYGLGSDPYDERAVMRVFQAKRRPHHLPLPLLIADISQFYDVALHVPEPALRLARAFLPEGLTLVLKKSARVPDIVTAGGDTVAIRIPDHPVPLALVRGLGKPIIGTSANISGKPSPLTAGEVSEQLGSEVDFIIDGGRAPGGVESTVIDLTTPSPTLVRRGAIPVEDIRKVCRTIL
ncbi:MAG: threonylcarbamoyl-AMP synthase [Dehalococcoidia bacterium]|nr:threonylcarbamoyl-AMP synthase [Dehalococcoidia bacterium]